MYTHASAVIAALALASLLASLTPDALLDAALKKLVQDGRGYQSLLRQKQTTKSTFTAWMAHAKVGGSDQDELFVSGQDQHPGPGFRPGLLLTWTMPNPVARVRGLQESVVASLEYVTSQVTRTTSSTVTVLFRQQHGKLTWSVLDRQTELDDTMNLSHVVWSNGRLYISGAVSWFSNSHRAGLAVYTPKGGSWTAQTATTEEECWEEPRLLLAGDGSIRPVQMQSRGYPKNLDACHATAQRSYVEQWKFVAGKPVLAWKHLRDTPYNLLDDIYPLIAKADSQLITKYCLSRKVANDIVKHYCARQVDTATVDFPNGVCEPNAKIIALKNLKCRFHFQRIDGHWVIAKVAPEPD